MGRKQQAVSLKLEVDVLDGEKESVSRDSYQAYRKTWSFRIADGAG